MREESFAKEQIGLQTPKRAEMEFTRSKAGARREARWDAGIPSTYHKPFVASYLRARRRDDDHH